VHGLRTCSAASVWASVPNLAFLTYSAETAGAELPVLTAANGGASRSRGSPVSRGPALQVCVLTDFCNECGNCVTFCPTAGRPWHDKPRSIVNARGVRGAGGQCVPVVPRSASSGPCRAAWRGQTARNQLDARPCTGVHRAHLAVQLELDPKSLAVREARVVASAPEATLLSLTPCAIDVRLAARRARFGLPWFCRWRLA
jgi:ferredoxin